MCAGDSNAGYDKEISPAVSVSLAEGITLAALTGLLIGLGVYPALLVPSLETIGAQVAGLADIPLLLTFPGTASDSKS
jgi:hypothetical protein